MQQFRIHKTNFEFFFSSDVAYSPDNKFLAAADSNRKVIVYNTEEYKVSLRLINHKLIVTHDKNNAFVNIFHSHSLIALTQSLPLALTYSSNSHMHRS